MAVSNFSYALGCAKIVVEIFTMVCNSCIMYHLNSLILVMHLAMRKLWLRYLLWYVILVSCII
jgi:hypothetical protein